MDLKTKLKMHNISEFCSDEKDPELYLETSSVCSNVNLYQMNLIITIIVQSLTKRMIRVTLLCH